MFNNYAEKGLVKSYDWDNYFVYPNQDMFTHESLTYETIQKFMQKAYRRAITLNPRFAWQRFYRAVTTGQLLKATLPQKLPYLEVKAKEKAV